MPAGENTEKLKNMRKLKRLLKLVPVDRRAVAEKLIAEIAFMEDTLNGLRRHIEKNGAIDHFKQGQQEFDRESPAVKTYNTMIQRYSLIYRQLTDMLPKPEPTDKGANELLELYFRILAADRKRKSHCFGAGKEAIQKVG